MLSPKHFFCFSPHFFFNLEVTFEIEVKISKKKKSKNTKKNLKKEIEKEKEEKKISIYLPKRQTW